MLSLKSTIWIDRECIKGIGELEGRMIVIIDLPKVHENIMANLTKAQIGLQ